MLSPFSVAGVTCARIMIVAFLIDDHNMHWAGWCHERMGMGGTLCLSASSVFFLQLLFVCLRCFFKFFPALLWEDSIMVWVVGMGGGVG